ncbi:MAG: hypothetical protein KGL92_08455 [Gammaproteobacteria bacterium]|nr:hypothetical protein [Gammaproteobacteria bacterium]
MNPRVHEDWSRRWHALQRRLAEGAITETAAAAAVRARAAAPEALPAPRGTPDRGWIGRTS